MGATQTITGVHRQTHGLTQQHADRAAPSLAPTGRHTRGHRHGGLRGGLGSQCVGITVAAGGPLCSWSLEEAWVGRGGVGQLGPGSLSRAALPSGPSHTGGHVLLARAGELGWGGQGASTKTQLQLCILLGSSGGASQGAANASLVLKTTARDPVKRLSIWGQGSFGPTSLVRSRPSITSWRSTEWLILSALSGEQMARPCALRPPPTRLPESFKQRP